MLAWHDAVRPIYSLRPERVPSRHHTGIVHSWAAVLQALLVPSHAGRNNRVMHLIGLAGTYTPPEGGGSNHWIVHMNSDALSLGTYSIPAGGTDDQEPHTEDEVYVVQAGRATLVTASGTVPVEPGSVVFVPAGETHKFTDITEDLPWSSSSRRVTDHARPAEIAGAERAMVAALCDAAPVRRRA